MEAIFLTILVTFIVIALLESKDFVNEELDEKIRKELKEREKFRRHNRF